MDKFRYITGIMAGIMLAILSVSCIEDGVTTSPSSQPAFSVDTLKMGTVFTDEVTTTHKFTVYNRHDKGIIISDIRMSGANGALFCLNVDGLSGSEFHDVEIRAKDSIFVMVEATLPVNDADLPVQIDANVDFVTNGVTSQIVVSAIGQDVERLYGHIVEGDVTFSATRPYQIFDSLVVARDARLILPAGARLYFHDGATMVVRGTLRAEGTVASPVELRGDRTGNVITDITFDLMSRQWEGLQFTLSSHDNYLGHTSVRNTWYGVIVTGDGTPGDTPKLTLHNSRLRNSGDKVLEVYDADVTATGCEFAEAANGVVRLSGGRHIFNHCTFANYYLFSAIGGAALQFDHLGLDSDSNPYNGGGVGTGETDRTPVTAAEITNSIIYGLGPDISHGDLTGTQVFLRKCLLKSKGSDDANFIGCLWDADPLYYTVRNDYIFDYRLKEDSPAIGAADPSLTLPAATLDAYGLQRGSAPDLGAYVYTAPPAE